MQCHELTLLHARAATAACVQLILTIIKLFEALAVLKHMLHTRFIVSHVAF